MIKNEIIDKLYLNPVAEVNANRKRLNPIHLKDIRRFSSVDKRLLSSKSVPDLFKNLNGNVIMQNWNTKTNIPKDIGEYINLPVIIDRKKLKNLNNLNTNSLKNLLPQKKN